MTFWRAVGAMALAVMLLTANHGLAEPSPVQPERAWLRQPVQPQRSSADVHQVTVGRWAAVAVLVGLSSFALWKSAKRRKDLPIVANSRIQLGSITRITAKAHLVVATVNGRSMLLAVTEENVSRLMWLDEEGLDDDLEVLAESAKCVKRSPESGRLLAPPEQTGVSVADQGLKLKPAKIRPGRSVDASRKASRSPSTFRDILADIVGLDPKREGKKADVASAAETLAAATEDRYVGRSASRTDTGLADRRASPEPMLNCEGQAAGLIARLNRSQI